LPVLLDVDPMGRGYPERWPTSITNLVMRIRDLQSAQPLR
jgi:hypothetical protein